MMVFIFVDLFAEDFVLAGIITYFVAEVSNTSTRHSPFFQREINLTLILFQCLNFTRYHLGKQNLARKTLIDKRFLI